MSEPHSSRLVTRRLRGAACSALLVLVLGACGDDDEPDDVTTQETTSTTARSDSDGDAYGGGGAPAGNGTEIVAEDFTLTSVSAAPGAEVRVKNKGQNPHTATSDDGDFDSGTVAAGESGSFSAPDEPGEYDFHCEIHPAMTGTLTVEE
ncbi:MAG: cupredoxin domain-containing protein [Acidimicrobiales bacterium]